MYTISEHFGMINKRIQADLPLYFIQHTIQAIEYCAQRRTGNGNWSLVNHMPYNLWLPANGEWNLRNFLMFISVNSMVMKDYYMDNQETDGRMKGTMQTNADGLWAEQIELKDSLAECKANLTLKTKQYTKMADERASPSSVSAKRMQSRVPPLQNGDDTATGLRQQSEVIYNYGTEVENNSRRLQKHVVESDTRQRQIWQLKANVISNHTNGEELAFSDGV
jgi:hypothetical protein